MDIFEAGEGATMQRILMLRDGAGKGGGGRRNERAYLVFCVRGHNMSKQGVMYDRCKQAGTPAQDEGTLF